MTDDFSRPNPQLEYLAAIQPPARSTNGGHDLRHALSTFNQQQELRRLVLAIVYEFEEWGAIFPWANVAHRLEGGNSVSTGSALKLMLVNLRAHLLEAGYVVPPWNHKGDQGFEPQTRGHYKSSADAPQDPPRSITFSQNNPIGALLMPDDMETTTLRREQLNAIDEYQGGRGGELLPRMGRHTAPSLTTAASEDVSLMPQTNYCTPLDSDEPSLQAPAATTTMVDNDQHDQQLQGTRPALELNARNIQRRVTQRIRSSARTQALARRTATQTPTQATTSSTTQTTAETTAQTMAHFDDLDEHVRRLGQAVLQADGFDETGTHSNTESFTGSREPLDINQQKTTFPNQTEPSGHPSNTSQGRLNYIPGHNDATGPDQDMEEGM